MNNDLLKPDNNEYRVPRRTGMGLLLASLVVNFFLLGLMAAPLLRPHPPFPPFGPPGNFIDYLTRELPPADAAILRDAYMKEEPTVIAGRQSMERGMQEVSAALQKPVIDQRELQKALDDIAAAHGKIQEGMNNLIKHAATDLSPEGRRIFSENGLHPPMPPSGMGPPSGRGMPPPRF